MRNATHTSILFTFLLSSFSLSLGVVSLVFPSPPLQSASSAWRSSSSAHSFSSSSLTSMSCRGKSNDDNSSFFSLMSRRRSIYISISSLIVPLTTNPTPTDATPDEINKKKGTVTLTINGPEQKLGLEVYDVTIGSSPPKPVVAIKRVVASRLQDQLQPGMICREYTSVQELQARLQGPFPMTIQFENLAAGGDAYDDFGKPMVTAEDALQMTAQPPQQQSPQRDQSLGNRQAEEYSITVLDRPSDPQVCTNIQSRRNDVLEIQYEAHLNSINGIVYDSSESRGTGQPYQMVLGSYDMIPGVDQGLYDMCIGETRMINIPSQLAYGTKGNKLYRIPPNTPLAWKVELVSINSVRKGDTRTRDDIEQRVEYY